MLAGDLGRAELPAIIAPKTVVVRFASGYNRQYATCAESGRLQKIQDAFRLVTGQDWTVRLELAQDLQDRARDSVPTQVPSHKAAGPGNPLIEAIKASLEARVMRIDDGFGQAVESATPDDETPWVAAEED